MKTPIITAITAKKSLKRIVYTVPGYSLTSNNQVISDEQIREWLLELIAGEESAFGYRKLT